jgi:hypothetical protein
MSSDPPETHKFDFQLKKKSISELAKKKMFEKYVTKKVLGAGSKFTDFLRQIQKIC